jgi:hypothetical protein
MFFYKGKSFRLVFVLLCTSHAFFFLFSSCNIGFDNADNPHYLYFKTIDVKTKQQAEGAPSHKITELWIYADGKLLGAFDKEKPIPVISNNDIVEINIFAGIRANGSKQDIQLYYLLKNISFNLNFTEGRIDTMDAVFSYSENANFVFIEDFEIGNIFTEDLDGDKNTGISVSNTDPHSGLKCGSIILNKDHPSFYVTSSAAFFQLPLTGNYTFLELDYKCNADFIIGLTGKEPDTGKEYSSDIILLTRKDNWNKLYLDLTSILQNSALGLYKVYFKSQHDDTLEKTEISLDNIKLIYLKK